MSTICTESNQIIILIIMFFSYKLILTEDPSSKEYFSLLPLVCQYYVCLISLFFLLVCCRGIDMCFLDITGSLLQGRSLYLLGEKKLKIEVYKLKINITYFVIDRSHR